MQPFGPNSPPVENVHYTIDRFWETFPPTWNSIRDRIRRIVTEDFDISVEQFHILRNVNKGITSMSELAAAKHISRPAISQGVDALVTKGLITRHQSTEDRRCVKLELTQSGQDLLEAVFRQNRQWMMEKLVTLSPEELKSISSALELLKQAFDRP